MKDKLRRYVEYHFRFNEQKDKKALVDEAYNNLLERYETLRDKYGDEARAYRETIDSIGDFTDLEKGGNGEYASMPELYDVGLVVSLILSIFGIIAFFITSVLAFILAVLSIVIYSGSAYYMYHRAQYEKNEKGDIGQFNHYLDRSFSYLKTAFTFWAVIFTILFGQLIARMFLFMEDLSDPFNTFTNFEQFVMLYFISFSISAAAIGVLFYLLYDRFMGHYYKISGKHELEGVFNRDDGGVTPGLTEWPNPIKPLLPWLMVLLGILSLFVSARIGYQNGSTESSILGIMFVLFSPRYYFTGLFLIAGYAALFSSALKEIRRRKVRLKWIVMSTVGLIVAFFLVSFILQLIGSVYFMFVTSLNPVIILSIGLGVMGIYKLITLAMGSPLDEE